MADNQSINKFICAIVQRRVLQCSYAESKRNVLRRIINVLMDGAVRQFSGREFQSLGEAT